MVANPDFVVPYLNFDIFEDQPGEFISVIMVCHKNRMACCSTCGANTVMVIVNCLMYNVCVIQYTCCKMLLKLFYSKPYFLPLFLRKNKQRSLTTARF